MELHGSDRVTNGAWMGNFERVNYYLTEWKFARRRMLIGNFEMRNTVPENSPNLRGRISEIQE